MKYSDWNYKNYIRDVADFPVKGISFKDISDIISSPDVYRRAIHAMEELVVHRMPDVIVSPDARGWLFAAPVSFNLGIPLHMVRKPGKLPPSTNKIKYKYEYASGELHLSKSHDYTGLHVLIMDDVNATGGTAMAIHDLVKKMGAEKVSYVSFVDIVYAGGYERLTKSKIDVARVVRYE